MAYRAGIVCSPGNKAKTVGASLLRHYLVVAIRNLARQRLHSALSILVLALGLTCFLAASLFALYLDSFERGFAKHDRTYVLYQNSSWPQIGYHAPLGHQSGFALADQLAIEIPELEAVARQVVLAASLSADGGTSNNQLRGVATTDAAWANARSSSCIDSRGRRFSEALRCVA
jgi:hypothetical protein